MSKKVSQKAIDKQLDINLRFKKSLNDQLKHFAKDDSYYKFYDKYEFDYSEYLVRMFILTPPEDMRPSTIIVEKSELAGVNPLQEKKIFLNDIVMPIAKIIKVGNITDEFGNPVPEEKRRKQGDIVTLPPNKVMGMVQNPEFIHYMQFMEAKGMQMLGEVPPKEIPRFQKEYSRYQFTRIGNLYPDDMDKVTFLLPSPEIKGGYKV